MLTCLTDPLLHLPTRLLRCCRSCIKHVHWEQSFFSFFSAGGHSLSSADSLCTLLLKETRLTLNFCFHQRLVLGKNSSLRISLVCTLFHWGRRDQQVEKTLDKKGICRHYKYNMGTLQTVLPPLQPFIFALPVHKPYYSMLNRWKAERWRGGEAAQWWFCNWLLYLWLVHYCSSNAEVSGGVWCAVQISLPSTWYLCID